MEREQLHKFITRCCINNGDVTNTVRGFINSNLISIDGNTIDVKNIGTTSFSFNEKVFEEFGLEISEIRITRGNSAYIEFVGIKNTKIEFHSCGISSIRFIDCNHIDLTQNSINGNGLIINCDNATFNSVTFISNVTPSLSVQIVPFICEGKYSRAEIGTLHISNNHLSILQINNVDINYISVFRESSISSAIFNNCNINQFLLYDLKHIKEIEFNNLKPIQDSISKKKLFFKKFHRNATLKFNNCDLTEYMIDLIDTDIRKASFYNTLLPRKVDFDDIHDIGLRENNSRIKDIILQLKYIAEDYKDSSTITYLRSLEQKINYRLSTLRKDREEFIALLFSRISNNFGLSWLLPAGEYLVFGAIFYCIIILMNNSCWDMNTFTQFLNPTHRFSIFDTMIPLSNWTGVIDFLARLVYAYLAVQTVTAFRKNLK